jgi:hypothetical protein
MYTTGKFAVVLGCSLAVTVVWQTARAADNNALLAEGVRLRRDRKDQQALAVFQEAVRQQATPRALAQLGLCEQALGLWVSAESHIQAALKYPDDPWIRKHARTLEESLTVVQETLGSLEPWGTPAGAEISLDGEVVGTLPLAQPLRATEGRHVLNVKAPRHLPLSRVVNVRPGELWREHVALAPAEAPAPARPAPTVEGAPASPGPTGIAAAPAAIPSSPSDVPVATDTPRPAADLPMWRRVLPWSLATGAVLAGAFGVWQHVAWDNGVDKFNGMPCGNKLPLKGSQECQRLSNDFMSARTGTIAGYGIAGALGVGAATVFILNAMVGSADPEGTVRVAAGPGDTGLSLLATF